MKYLGYCENCYQDIIDGDQMDCCGHLLLVTYDDLDVRFETDNQDVSPEQLAGEIFEDKLDMYRREH